LRPTRESAGTRVHYTHTSGRGPGEDFGRLDTCGATGRHAG
jgi:hypothetical protein